MAFTVLKCRYSAAARVLPDAGDSGENRFQTALAVLGPGIGDGKPVDFILNGGHQIEGPLMSGNGDLAAVTGNGPGTVTVILDHAIHGDLEPERLQNGLYRIQMPLSAVQQDQVGQPSESASGVLLLLIPCQTPSITSCMEA